MLKLFTTVRRPVHSVPTLDQKPARTRFFYAVVHVTDDEQALANTRVALENGADGVFLIDHDRSAKDLLQTYGVVRESFPEAFIGLNLLDRAADHALAIIDANYTDVSALWVDDAGIGNEVSEMAKLISSRRSQMRWSGQYFGSVAFKHQAPVSDPAATAALAAPHVDVVVTSGTATGSAPEVAKVRAMKRALGTKPLALASGITPENYPHFAPFAERVLVATGVSHDFHTLDGAKVAALAAAVQAYEAAPMPH